MIKNERQYKITHSRADEVRNTVGELQRTALPEGLQPDMRELRLDALRGRSATSKPSSPSTTRSTTQR